MQQPIETMPTDMLQEIFVRTGPAASGIFAKTSRYFRIQILLINFIHAYKNNQQAMQSDILVDIYSNYPLLLHKSAKPTIPSWCQALENTRKAMDAPLMNRLLATALLKILNEQPNESLNREFITLLSMLRLQSKQLANSVLALLMRAEGNNKMYDLCKSNHSIASLIHDQRYCNMSLNDAKLFISPFHEIHSKNFCLTPFLDRSVSRDAHGKLSPNNYLKCTHAILKIIPDDHILWKEHDIRIRNLMLSLALLDLRYCNDYLTAILVTIQRRVPDANFLKTFHEQLSGLIGPEHIVTQSMFDAMHLLINSEEAILKYLRTDFYEKLSTEMMSFDIGHNTIFIRRMTKYINKLQIEKHIMEGLTHLLQLFKKPRNYCEPAIPSILLLLPKIKSQDFLTDCIRTIFECKAVLDKDKTRDLSSICTQPQLNEHSIKTLLTEFYVVYKTKTPSELQYLMTIDLCSRLESQSIIDEFLTKSSLAIQIEVIHEHPPIWFSNKKNLMNFASCLILSIKIERNDSVNSLMKILHFKAANSDMWAIALIARVLPDIKSKSFLFEYIPTLYNMKLGINEYYSTNLCLLTHDNDIIRHEIDRFKQILKKQPEFIYQLYFNLIPLLLNSPKALSKNVTDIVYHVIDRLAPDFNEYIKEYSATNKEMKSSLVV